MKKRGSGILLHITSLPSPFGIGDLGPQAYAFADFLHQVQQSYWQVLPLNPTDQACGNSPYSSISAYAGNTLLISPELLLKDGFLTADDLAESPPFPANRCDYSTVIPYKAELLRRAYTRFKETNIERAAFEGFYKSQRSWLEDYALFVVIKNLHGGKAWNEWAEPLRDREARSLKQVKNDCRDEIVCEQFLQYLFFKQWLFLKAYCNERSIRIIGDIPIYVNFDSADVWMNPGIFKLDKKKQPLFAAGVPPDYFSTTGQLWGNPVYRWDVLKKTKYEWWLQRIAHNLTLIDVLRIDHFRGFVAYWEVPAIEKTAINGKWITAPAKDFFNALIRKYPSIPLIAEDLGLITDDVREVMKHFGFPGMKVLQFAFGEDLPTHPYLPHNYMPDCVVYTGTHDNNTTRGWFEREANADDRTRLYNYLGREVSAEEVSVALIRLAMMSAADTVVFPLQDVLGLGAEARINRPSTAHGNWEWRLTADQLSIAVSEKMQLLTRTYGRSADNI